uniref:Uncharacterized protein n=1 Tax=Tetranychus urticae TaxID=32264 RepID=T1L4N1_TETUR
MNGLENGIKSGFKEIAVFAKISLVKKRCGIMTMRAIDRRGEIRSEIRLVSITKI